MLPDKAPKQVLASYGALADVGANLTQPLSSLPIAIAEPSDACGPVTVSIPGAALLVLRGNCSFTDKARAVQAAGGAAMLLYDSQPGCVTMGFEPNASDWLRIAAVSLPRDSGLRMAATLAAAPAATGGGAAAAAAPTADGYVISLALADLPRVDAGAGLLWALAVGCVLAGGLWSGADHLGARKAEQEDEAPLLRGSASRGGGGGQESLDLSPRAALAFVVVASGMLLLMFFLLNKAFFYVLLCMFCLASIQSQTVLYAAGLGPLLARLKRNTNVQLPWLGPCPLAVLACIPLAVAVAVVWAVWRNEEWSWLLQDLQGVAVMLLVLRTLRIPSLKVACILLPGCLAYDVFWVFIQPLLFGGGESVMVEVAQGGSSGEYIPMLLRVPYFGRPGLGGYSLLGFGDVILPGMLVAWTRRVDLDLSSLAALGLGWPGSGLGGGLGLEAGSGGKVATAAARSWLRALMPRSYFPYAVASYGAGLCLTYAALAYSWFGDQGQPALLYLVPCTLLTVLCCAAARGELRVLWRGGGAATRGSVLGRGGLTRDRDHDHDSDPGDGQGGYGGGASTGGGTGGLGAVAGVRLAAAATAASAAVSGPAEDVEVGRSGVAMVASSANSASLRRGTGASAAGLADSRSPSPA